MLLEPVGLVVELDEVGPSRAPTLLLRGGGVLRCLRRADRRGPEGDAGDDVDVNVRDGASVVRVSESRADVVSFLALGGDSGSPNRPRSARTWWSCELVARIVEELGTGSS